VRAQKSEAVFRTLDGHDFEFDGGACHVEVYGVFDDGEHRWVQLALDGDRQQMLTLRIEAQAKDKPDCTLVSLALGLAPA
jgi:hypothetical protein